MTRIAAFTETEVWVVHATLKERYGHDVEMSMAETEGRVDPDSVETANDAMGSNSPDYSPLFWGD